MSGTLGTFEPIENIQEKLDNFITRRKEGGKVLCSSINIHPKIWMLKDNIKLFTGVVFDEYRRISKRIVKNEEGRFRVEGVEETVDTRMGQFFVTEKSIILAERAADKYFIFRVVSQALNGTDKYIRPVTIDIQQIAQDYRKNWLGSIIRNGHWQSGVLYGDDLRRDSVIGREFIKCTKNQIGIETAYFGGRKKVRITRDGTIVVYANLTNNLDLFVDFIREELLRYVEQETRV